MDKYQIIQQLFNGYYLSKEELVTAQKLIDTLQNLLNERKK